ncbi:MAG: MFS transporter [Candidatus Melainabacteria bacterium]|nr:MFS transporter [Candidatus Melainabacteria bacterium]
MPEKYKSISVLTVSTASFVVCFACWVLYGVLVAFLVDNGVYSFDAGQVGWLLGVPILTGSLLRLPAGVLTDRYGGRVVFVTIMLISAGFMYLVSYCTDFWQFFLAGLGFGISGASFAVGIAYTSLWFPREKQGTALGIFGAGNAGASLTSMGAPHLLNFCTDNLHFLEGWRQVPRIYAAILVVVSLLFWFCSFPRKVEKKGISILQQLAPLREVRVWRFGLYYFFVFGGFVALSQWLISYYLNVYAMSLAMAGLMASIFSLPSGVIRAIGGWLSDKFGARSVMYSVLVSCLIASLALCVPRMDVETPGQGVMCTKKGIVESVTASEIVVAGKCYKLRAKQQDDLLTIFEDRKELLVWPTTVFWQEPLVKVGDSVLKKQILAQGVTHIFFQANVWIFTFFVLVLGVMTGIGKAAVYRHIPDYFPHDVGVVGGIVGVIGGLGGFVGPIVFGYLLQATGIWTTCWMLFAMLSAVCLWWMHVTITRMLRQEAPHLTENIEPFPRPT